MMKAKVERFEPVQVAHMRTGERAILPCGCCVFVGRDSSGVVTTGAQPCAREGHERITDRFSGLLREAQQHPHAGRLLVDVCRYLLTQAAWEIGT